MGIFSRYRVHIGLSLVILILIGGILLIWKNELFKNVNRPTVTSSQPTDSANLQKEIENLKKEIARLNDTLSKTEIQRTETTSEEIISQGKVAGESTAFGQEVAGKININTADATTLDSLPGIGPVYASRIIEYRQANGGFKSIEEIEQIKGIGPATFEKMKDKITI
ncbi:MAG: hypothetical protein COX39_03285 [Candidatus Nealsonbacteria bacterium CG23_combo_of_CG06-09_8_20_14_all_40_13]|uniref:Helix-hairpin-helix DNA-binding motif class 1 domain-containing protein n=1 Tax=Candidatus Nealsonbacteria bacterium CG23_combo_of_CG06-09_8_20_14_all_40_13 TaxID=1974724 RepID=A0A2G9YQ61_9BACT|nr:MAG: hypothetical protein COX39_03285 [Candidatus Nealsonbacteria bacterium CG23_combo_of_CG06-09_8_20_14_all_40_13]PIR71112.1 MAG: hypothetical protein COU44_01395 [Candidatus Nealsonbacteria bacterium CG10_big_fil_rev_8_21_14_0_10_40_24]PIU43399.1 MAG: hypothetical protein COS97_01235 [Candidatus Nealsonbacteria bacterium CG07_land_8_20_14_0_80_40_10]